MDTRTGCGLLNKNSTYFVTSRDKCRLSVGIIHELLLLVKENMAGYDKRTLITVGLSIVILCMLSKYLFTVVVSSERPSLHIPVKWNT